MTQKEFYEQIQYLSDDDLFVLLYEQYNHKSDNEIKQRRLALIFDEMSARSSEMKDYFLNLIADRDDSRLVDSSVKIKQYSGNSDIFKVSGDSMINFGIFDEDLVRINRNLEVKDENIIVGRLNSLVFVKKVKFRNNKIWLFSGNSKYFPYCVESVDAFTCFGPVVSVWHNNCINKLIYT